MNPHPSRSRSASAARIADEAAAWLARRDRGLTADEQDAYLQWLAADVRHAEEMSRHATALERMMALCEWQPGSSTEPNPDLFAPPSRRWRPAFLVFGLAAAAAITVGIATWSLRPASPTAPGVAEKSYLRVNERHALPDGSVVELKDGSHIVTDFSPAARRITLVGEAHFTVTKDATRPFVVAAEGVAVRAIGTAFNVRAAADAVEVLVIEGSVSVHPPGSDPAAKPATAEPDARFPILSARQRTVVSLAASTPLQVSDVDAAQIADTLAWQAPRLQFWDTPLAVAAAEFNERNRTQIIIGDADLKALPINGSFRVGNVEGFVRLLEVTLDLRAKTRGADEIVLTRAK